MNSNRHQILIIGGGTAGITVAAQMLRKRPNLDIGIIEPSELHYYQPAYTLVAAGDFKLQNTVRSEEDQIPTGASWIRDRVTELRPRSNQVVLQSGSTLNYDYLVVCPGIQIDYDKIEGLRETLGKNNVCCNYEYHSCSYTWEVLQNFKGGRAIFTNPNTPIKCGGAPQKIMYLTADYLRKKGLSGKTSIHYTTAGGVIFGVQPFKASLEKVIKRYGIQTDWFHNLRAIDGKAKTATFDLLKDGKVLGEETMSFDMIHVTPPMSAPDFIKQSELHDGKGWMKVDKHLLQSPDFPNVFGLGDAMGTPNAKTGAAVRKQVPVMISNLFNLLDGKAAKGSYNGYGSCPLVTGYGKMILAEFDYENKATPTFPFDQSKERLSMYWMKKYFLPWFYWNRMMKGLG